MLSDAVYKKKKLTQNTHRLYVTAIGKEEDHFKKNDRLLQRGYWLKMNWFVIKDICLLTVDYDDDDDDGEDRRLGSAWYCLWECLAQ